MYDCTYIISCTNVRVKEEIKISQYFERLAALKKYHHYSQQQIADALGISLRAYQYYEYGEREPTVSTIIALAKFYGVSTDYLLGLTDELHSIDSG